MKKTTTKALAALLLLAATAAAEDFETRYHDAYVLEVVEGRVADAAKAYLALLRERDLPPRLRAQCEFRFAVTCVLLGRADEARARLAGLAADPATPAGLRAQVAEYRKAVEGVAPGSEIEKKLDGYVDALAAHAPGSPPDVYRKIQVLGRPALPYLRRLLGHTDAGLRQHAFVLLARMDVEGLGGAWTPALGQHAQLASYLKRHPEEVPAVETTLRTLEPAALAKVLDELKAPFTTGFVADVAGVPGVADDIVPLLPHGDPETALLESWIRGDDDRLSYVATVEYLHRMREPGPADLFPAICRRLNGGILRKDRQLWRPLLRYAESVPEPTLRETFAGLLADDPKRFVMSVLADRLAGVLFAGEGAARNRDLFWQWYEAFVEHPVGYSTIGVHLRNVLVALPRDEAVALVGKIFGGPARRQPGPFVKALGFERPEDVDLARAALEAADTPEVRQAVAEGIHDGAAEASRPFLEGIASTYLDLVRDLSPDMTQAVPVFVVRLPEDEGRRVADRFFRGLAGQHEEQRAEKAGNFFDHGWLDVTAGFRERIAPLFADWERDVGPAVRAELALRALRYLHQHVNRDYPLGDAAETYEAFVRNHLTDLAAEDFGLVEDVLSWQVWLPQAPPGIREHLPDMETQQLAPQVVEHFTAHPGEVNEAIIWLAAHDGEDVRTPFVDAVLDRGRPGAVTALDDRQLLRAATATGLEAAVRRDDLGPAAVAAVAARLAEVRPTEILVDVVRRLVATRDRAATLSAIGIARSLGTKALLPDLSRLLDSLDEEVRSQAMKAIDELLQLEEQKESFRAAAAKPSGDGPAGEPAGD